MKGINPVFFGGFLVGVEFALMACEAFAKSQCGPVAGFVYGAFVKLRIAETLGEKGAVSVFFLEMSGEFAQGEAHATGGEVGLPPGFHDEEPPQLGDEGKSASPGERIPAYPFVAVLEAQGRPRPAKHGTKHRITLVRTGLVNPLPDGVAGGSAGFR